MQSTYQLSKHPIGSLREMWHIAYPLMLSLLSGSLMMLADRLFLAHYSLQALTASANAGMAFWVCLIVPMLTSGIAEVFAGQYHGSDQKHRMGEPVWQMLWLAVFTIPLFCALAWFAAPYIFWGTGNETLEIEYFSTLMYFGPFLVCMPALSGFFVAKGTVKLVTMATVIGNLLNVILDPILIFGWGPFPEMGVAGAAIATGLGNAVGQVFFLLIIFAMPSYRKEYGTGAWAFRPKAFWECIKIGLPSGLGHLNELLAHFVFFRIVILSGGFGIAVVSLAQSIYICGHFVIEGVSKAVTAIASNLIGGQQTHLLDKVLKSAVKLVTIFSLALAAAVLTAPEHLFGLVMSEADRPILSNPEFLAVLRRTLGWICVFYLLDGIYWAIIGMLTAAGDTKFIMVVSTLCNWLLYVIPVYVVLVVFEGTVDQAFMAIAICSAIMTFIYYLRYKSQRNIYVVDQTPTLGEQLV